MSNIVNKGLLSVFPTQYFSRDLCLLNIC